MTDEWHIDRIDLDAYCERIGVSCDLTADAKALAELHRAHVAAIQFENLDIVLRGGISVEMDDVISKLITRRRGGYCYEHGLLFAGVLERIGFSVDRLLARVGGGPAGSHPRSHMALHVRSNDGDWLADVGFGGGLLEPLRWGDERSVLQGEWTYRMVRDPEGWRVEECRAGEWSTMYRFSDEPQHFSDIAVANWFTSTNPASPFVRGPVIMRKEPGSHLRLHRRTLTLTTPYGSTDERLLSDSQVVSALEQYFKLELNSAEVRMLLDALG